MIFGIKFVLKAEQKRAIEKLFVKKKGSFSRFTCRLWKESQFSASCVAREKSWKLCIICYLSFRADSLKLTCWQSIWTFLQSHLNRISPLQFTITWYKNRHAEEQTAHWENQNKATLLNILLFWMSQWAVCSPAWRSLYHVIVNCKGPIGINISIWATAHLPLP